MIIRQSNRIMHLFIRTVKTIAHSSYSKATVVKYRYHLNNNFILIFMTDNLAPPSCNFTVAIKYLKSITISNCHHVVTLNLGTFESLVPYKHPNTFCLNCKIVYEEAYRMCQWRLELNLSLLDITNHANLKSQKYQFWLIGH